MGQGGGFGTGGGLVYTVVAQGQADAPSFPVATGTYDTATHLCWCPPGVASVSSASGGYYTWDGSEISSAAWSPALYINPYGNSFTWQIWKILSLVAPIQHISGTINWGTGTGYENVDTTIASLPDYTKAVVLPACFGAAAVTGNWQIVGMTHYLTSNTNLRRRVYKTAGATAGSVNASTIIVPTR